MSGLPLQVGDLPPGTVAVRVIRQSFANNVANQPVELQVVGSSGKVLEVPTDASGRATFPGDNIYHGHVRPWEDLTQRMQSALIRWGMASSKGKIQ